MANFSYLAGSPALYLKDERRDESRAVDDTPLTNAEGKGRGDRGNSQLSIGQAENLLPTDLIAVARLC